MVKKTKCKVCRSVNKKLYLKGKKCYTKNCPIEQKRLMPGFYVRNFTLKQKRFDEYDRFIFNKRIVRQFWKLRKRQIKSIFSDTEVHFNLASRMEYCVFATGWIVSLNSARQLIDHNFFLVNGKPCNLKSRILKLGDQVSVKPHKQKKLETIYKSRDFKYNFKSEVSFLQLSEGFSFKLIDKPFLSKHVISLFDSKSVSAYFA